MLTALKSVPWVRDVQMDQMTANVTVAKADYNAIALVEALKKAGFGGEIVG